MSRLFLSLAAGVFLVAGAGCGASAGGASSAPLNVSAAKSLRKVLPTIAPATYNFAGSNALQRQIERGAPADVFASASPKEAQALYRERRCDRPRTFATNTLVLIVPAGNPGRVTSIAALKAGGRRLAVGAAGVPVGDYTRTVLQRLSLTSILTANAVSQEPDVGSITAKVALGSADAGIVYHTDALTARDRTRELRLPARAQPTVAYQLCAVRRDGANTAGARRFIGRVLSSQGRRALTRLGFGLPPRG